MQLIGKPIVNSLFTFLLHMILNVTFFKHNSYKTVQGFFFKYLCVKDIGIFLHMDRWNLNGFFTFNFDSNIPKKTVLIGKLKYTFLVHHIPNKEKIT